MPFLRAIGDEFKERFSRKDTAPVNSYEGFTSSGAVVLRDRRGTSKAEIPEVDEKSLTLGSDPLAIYKPTGTKAVSAAKAMAQFTGWTYAAVNAVGSEVANIELRLFQISGKDHKELDDSPLLDLLESPNEYMTGPELKYVTTAHLDLTGNCYWLLDGVSDDTGKPRAIYPLDPGRVKVQIDRSSFPYRLAHYEFTIDGKVYKFEPYQILHMKYPDPSDPFVGIGIPQSIPFHSIPFHSIPFHSIPFHSIPFLPFHSIPFFDETLQTIPTWIDSDNYAMEYNRKFFINGAQVGLYIQTDTNVEANIDRIRKGFGNRHEGVENAHKVPVLPKGAKLEHTGVTQKDMDFNNLTEATRDRILAAFRVSKTILGTAESDTNRATAETADYVFAKRTVKPKMVLITSFINAFLTPRYGDDLYLTFIDTTPEDKEFRTQEMTAAAGVGVPIMTQNEARENYLGLGPVDGGDQLMVPASLMPAGKTDTQEGEDPTPALEKAVKTAEGWKVRGMRVRAGGKTAQSGGNQMRRALTAAFKKQVDKTVQYQVKGVTELTHDEYMEHWKRFSDRSEVAQAQLHKVFEGINSKQKKDVLENLPEATGIEKSIGELFDLKEWIGITIDLATPILTALAKDEAASAFAMIGAQNQDILANESTEAALERGIAMMARSYNETTLAQLKETLNEKLTQEGGTNLRELTDAVDGVYSFADERRAGLIAKTESFRAANWANREAWAQSGVVKSLKWFTAEDDNVCPQCSALDGKEVAIDEKFFDDSYGDGQNPPAHPDCRCYIRPEEISIE